jgi:hypothetical protein
MEQLTKELVNKCLYELKRPENRVQVEQYVLDPCLDHLFAHLYNRLFPFLRVLSGLYLLIIVLLVLIVYLLLKR